MVPYVLTGYNCVPIASHTSRTARKYDMTTLDFGCQDDIRDCVQSSEADYIVSLIGKYGSSSFGEMLEANVNVAHSIMQTILDTGRIETRMLFIGSAAEYGTPNENPITEDHELAPVNLYGLTKMYQSKLVAHYYKTYGIRALVARTFNLRGRGLPSCLAVGNFQRQIDEAADGAVIKVGNLATQRDYLDIHQAVRDYEKIFVNGIPGEFYNVCSGIPLKISDLLNQLISESGKQINVAVDTSLLRDNDTAVVYGDRTKLDSL